MRTYTRYDLDQIGLNLPLPPLRYASNGTVRVNGAGGWYGLYFPETDKSVLPCLTGQVGGMIGGWENWITAWHLNNFYNYDTYIDVGANAGYFSGLAAVMGKDVIAVEANPLYATLLERMSTDNNFYNFSVYHKAVDAGMDNEVELQVPDELHGGASIHHGATNLPGRSVKVKTINLDFLTDHTFVKDKRVLIKMDIEGAEQQAWQGAGIMNKFVKPTYIIEYTPRHYEDNFFNQLQEYGTVTKVNFDGFEEPVTKDQANAEPDWLTLVVRPTD